MNKKKNLYSMVVLDQNAQEAFAVIASDYSEACTIAIQKCSKARYEGDHISFPMVDPSLSYEITCAGDIDGAVYDVTFSKSNQPVPEIKTMSLIPEDQTASNEQAEALRLLAKAYANLSEVWLDSWEGPDNFGGVMSDLGVLPYMDLYEASAELEALAEDLAGNNEGVSQEVPDLKIMDPVELAQMLVLSTAHLTRKVGFDLIHNQYNPSLIVYKKGDYGYMIYVPESIAEEWPACIQEVLKLAQWVNAQWVMLDCDGPLHAALPLYYW
ncbi:hypothetical protein J7E73_10440 [Paenibacillus albidus]|nr:hypothetical protein [Paenibacillus albidus]